jgi:membrane protease YdiL (CAAX protease family)
MTDKQINRWLRRRFSPIGWLLLLYYGLMTLLTTITVFSELAKQYIWAFAAGDFSTAVNWDAVNANAWGYIASMAVGLAVLDAWKGSSFWKQEVFFRNSAMRGKTFACFLFFCMGAQMINTLWVSLLEMLVNLGGGSLMPVLEQVSGSSDTFSMFLYASVLAPVWEELLFRGWILRTLRPYGKRFAILGSAVLFGLFHGNLLQTPYALLVGLLLGYVTVEYSLFWSIALHTFNNLVLADLLSRLTASWPETAAGTVNLILLGTSAVLSLVILIKNRAGLRAYRESEYLDRRCLKCFFTSPGIMLLAIFMVISMTMMFFL